MPLTITLPDSLGRQLKTKAKNSHISLTELVVDLLVKSIGSEPEQPSALDMLIAEIRATPPNLANIRPAKGSLAEALRHSPDNPDFNLEQWNSEWAVVEAEMKAITTANNIAEG